jgi:DNA-binding CsgD family transcriptional regulator
MEIQMTFIEDTLSQIDESSNYVELWEKMLKIVGDIGFSCASYLDVRKLPISNESPPFYQTSAKKDFVESYISLGLIGYDPVVTRAASSNASFTWADCHEFGMNEHRRTGGKGRARQVLELARDHGYTQGFVIPLHAVDHLGQPASALISLYWADNPDTMAHATPFWLKLAGATYHEKLLSLRGQAGAGSTIRPHLTDREREVLVWACRGKTRSETADILNIADRTVEYHFENAMRKLGVHNKFHAIAVAMQSRLIVP